jgi:geranylgeranyl reductase family protein
MKMHDVIIVGGGPIGSFTAYLLAKEGLDVVLLERKSAIGKDVDCTGIVSTECFKKFNLPENAVVKSLRTIKAFSPSGNYIVYNAPSIFAYVVDRGIFDSEINRKALKEGATLYLETKAEKIRISESDFRVKAKIKGEKTELSSRVGVIATGFELNSFDILSKRNNNFLYGAQTDVATNNVKDVKIYLGNKIAPGSFAWIVPTNGNSAKIGLISNENAIAHLKNFLRNPFIRDKITINNNTPIKCSPIPFGKISKSYARRLVIVGEAAGQVKTTTGGGIYFGLLCSEIAVQTIINAFKRNDFSEKIFKEYERRWREKIEPELKAGTYLRNIFSRLSDKQIDLLINFVSKNGILPTIKKKAKFDWHKDVGTSLLQHIFLKKLFQDTI